MDEGKKNGANSEKKVVVKLKELLKSRGISLRELSRITDIRHAALSELANNKRKNINFSHIERIANTFDIDDIREIIDLANVADENSEDSTDEKR